MNARQHLAISLGIAVTTELVTATAGGLSSPTRWLIRSVVAMPSPNVGRVLAVAVAVVLVAANSVVAVRRVVPDDDAPIVGRAAAGLMLGLPLALLETAVLAVVWLVFRSG